MVDGTNNKDMPGFEIPQGPRELILEAPQYLEPGQNLYDQPPFADAVLRLQQGEFGLRLQTELCLNSEGCENFLRRILTDSLSDFDLTIPVNEWQQQMSGQGLIQDKIIRLLEKKLGSTHGGAKYRRIPAVKKPNIALGIAPEILNLLEYPFIGEYVRDQTELAAKYDKDGRFNTRTKEEAATKSYAKWLYDRTQQQGRVLSLGVIVDIFEDSLSPVSAVKTAERKREGLIRWVIKPAEMSTRLSSGK